MQDLDDTPPGALPENPEDELRNAIQAELVLVLEELRQRFDVDGLSLAWATHLAISRNLRAHEGIEACASWTQRLAKDAQETHSAIVEILRQDARDNRRMH